MLLLCVFLSFKPIPSKIYTNKLSSLIKLKKIYLIDKNDDLTKKKSTTTTTQTTSYCVSGVIKDDVERRTTKKKALFGFDLSIRFENIE